MINVTMTGYGTMDFAAPIRADTNLDGVTNVAGTVRNFVYRGDLSVSSRGLWAGKDHVDDCQNLPAMPANALPDEAAMKNWAELLVARSG